MTYKKDVRPPTLPSPTNGGRGLLSEMTPFHSNWRPRLPAHLKQQVPSGATLAAVQKTLAAASLPTVCEEAKCPNRTDCWARGTLTFQILGSVCTRRCGFCAETTGKPLPVNPFEAEQLARAAVALNLKHVVITSPARDDLPDQGSDQFAAAIFHLRQKAPAATVEVLIPDFQGRADLLKRVFAAKPDILNHNLETVRRLTPRVRARATYDRSLDVLKQAAAAGLAAKSGLMVGLGETMEEIFEAFDDLARHNVSLVTVGQYLPPSPAHLPVDKFYSLEEFAAVRKHAESIFKKAMVGPLVRSSYHADEMVRP
jgi:lipoic acid synthetase